MKNQIVIDKVAIEHNIAEGQKVKNMTMFPNEAWIEANIAIKMLKHILSISTSAEEVFNAAREIDADEEKEGTPDYKYDSYQDYLKSLTP